MKPGSHEPCTTILNSGTHHISPRSENDENHFTPKGVEQQDFDANDLRHLKQLLHKFQFSNLANCRSNNFGSRNENWHAHPLFCR